MVLYFLLINKIFKILLKYLKMARILTGVQSTGTPHLGNLLGAVLPAIEMAKLLEEKFKENKQFKIIYDK